MSKSISEYIHYYIGQPCTYDDPYQRAFNLIGVVTERIIMFVRAPHLSGAVTNVKPHLRRLEDITEGELILLFKADGYYRADENDDMIGCALNIIKGNEFRPEAFHFLIGNGFDLFGLIDSGAAIDAKKLQSQQQ